MQSVNAAILDAIADGEGLTTPEIAERFGMPRTEASWRVMALDRYGLIRPDGVRQTAERGRPATVWRVCTPCATTTAQFHHAPICRDSSAA